MVSVRFGGCVYFVCVHNVAEVIITGLVYSVLQIQVHADLKKIVLLLCRRAEPSTYMHTSLIPISIPRRQDPPLNIKPSKKRSSTLDRRSNLILCDLGILLHFPHGSRYTSWDTRYPPRVRNGR